MSIKKNWWIIATLLFLLSTFLDVYTTYNLLQSGDYYESNPAVSFIIGESGTSAGLWYIYLHIFILLILIGYVSVNMTGLKQLTTPYKLILFIMILLVSVVRLSGGINNIYV